MVDRDNDLLKTYCFDIVKKAHEVDNSYINIFLSLIPHAKTVINENKEAEKARAGRINILGFFNQYLENYQRDLLHALLDPKGSHRHGTEYLRIFLEIIGLEDLVKQHKDTLHEIEVLRETHGRIDLLFKHPEFCVIIEMKINAGDQDKQIERYHDKMLEEYNDENIFVYYLTLDGHKPTDQSVGKIAIDDVKCISFREHIYKWIYRLPVRINEPLLSSALVQYRHCIEHLTNQTEEEVAMSQRLLEIILKDERTNDLTMDDLDLLGDTIQALKHHKKKYKFMKVLLEVEKELKKQESAIKGKINMRSGDWYPLVYINSSNVDEHVWTGFSIEYNLADNIDKLDEKKPYHIGISDKQQRRLDYFNNLEGYNLEYSKWWPIIKNIDIDINNFDAKKIADELINLFNQTQEILKKHKEQNSTI